MPQIKFDLILYIVLVPPTNMVIFVCGKGHWIVRNWFCVINLFTHSGASLWGPLKELWETVDAAVLKRQPENVHLLDLQLKKHKPHFLSLFKNPVRQFACKPAS